MGRRLTETEYQSRRIKLSGHIEAARRAYVDAAYRLEMGEGDKAAVTKERTAIEDLEARLSGLDAARVRAAAVEDAEREEATAEARQKVAATFVSLLDKRLSAARAMGEAIDTLIEAWKAKIALEGDIGAMLSESMHLSVGFEGPNAGSMRASSLSMTYDAINQDFAGSFIAGRLAREGHNLENLNWNSASQFNGDTSMVEYCGQSNATVLAQVARHVPEVWTLTHGEEHQVDAVVRN